MAAKKAEKAEKADRGAWTASERAKALRQHGWVSVGGGNAPIEKWAEGVEVEGRYAGTRQGSIGFLIDFEDAQTGEPRTFGCPAILRQRMSGVPFGSLVFVVCIGKVPSKYATDAWAFDVLVSPEPAPVLR